VKLGEAAIVAPGLHCQSGVVPTVRDVIGAPVPGLPSAPGTHASTGANTPFERLMEQVLRHEQEAAKAPPKAARSIRVPRTISARRSEPLRAPTTISPVAIPRGVVPKRVPAPAVPSFGFKPGRHVIAAAIRKAAATAGVDSALSVAVARAESNLNPSARSSDGRSKGTFQVLPSTAAEMRRKFAAGTVVRPTGHDDVAVGVGYLRYLHDLFARGATLTSKLDAVAVPDGDERRQFAVAAFNAGEGRVAQAQKRAAAAGLDPTSFDDVRSFLPQSTRAYVDRVAGYTEEETVEIA
jgi:soluble lytic murein transglycosylase-like protein